VADGGGVVAALPTFSDSVVERALIAAEKLQLEAAPPDRAIE